MPRPLSSLSLFVTGIVLWLLALAGLASGQSADPAATGNPPSTTAQQPGGAAAPQSQAGTPPAQPAADAPAEPERPVTTRFPDNPIREVEALLQPPPLPKKEKVTLVGGQVRKIDRIRNRVSVNVFGGKRMDFEFDERTRIFRDGTETTSMGIRDGDRIYIDSQLDENKKIFARNIHIVTNLVPAEATGQITGFNLRNGRMSLNDQLSSRPITFLVTKDTRITDSRGAGAADIKELQRGALVEVSFEPAKGAKGRRAIAEEIKLIATVNSEHLFEGPITYVDMRSGLIAIRNERDNRTYDLALDPALAAGTGELREGRKATARARYTGQDYRVTQIRLHEEARADEDRGDTRETEDSERKEEKED